MTPSSNFTVDLGAASNGWRTIYASNASLAGMLTANGVTLTAPMSVGSNGINTTGSISSSNEPSSAVYTNLLVASSANIHNGFSLLPTSVTSIGTDLVPDSNGIRTLGASNTVWSTVYASNASLTGSLTANGATLSAPLVMGSNSVTLTGSVASSGSRATAVFSQSNDANFVSVNSNFTVQTGATTNFGTSLLPGSNDAFDIGASNTTWKNVYASNAYLTGSLTANGATLSAPLVMGNNSVTLTGSVASSTNRATAIYSQSNDANFASVNSNFTVQPGATTNFGTSLLPGSNGAHDIGASNTTWKNVYASNASLTGSLIANGATLSAPLVLGSNSVTLTGSVASSGSRATAVFSQSNDANFSSVNSNFTVQPGATTNFGTSLLPGSNDAFDIGASAATWKDLYASNASLTGSLTANGATLSAPLVMGSNSVTLTGSVASLTNRATAVFSQSNDANFVSVNSNFTVQLGATTSFGTSLLPASSGAHDIGSSNTIWRNVHASNVSLSGTGNFAGSLTTTNIYPSVNNSHSIGTSSNFFQSICGSELVAKSFIQTPALYSTGFVGTNHLGVDGGSAVGIRYASTIDSTWQTYYASAGSLKSAANGISCASLDGRNAPALRTRVPNTTSNSVIWENSSETCLMSLAPDTGKLLVTGPFSCAGGITSSNGISVTSGSSTFAGTLTGSNGLTIAAGTATFASNLAVAGPIVSAGGITSSNGLSVTSGSSTFAGALVASNGLSVAAGSASFAGLVTASNGLTVAAGSTSFASNLTVLGPLVASNSIVGASFGTTGAMTAGSGSFAGNVTVNGDFSVGGRIDYISTSELMVADKHITLASSATPTDAGASGAGMYVQGSNYATSNSTISLTWNTGVNGNYWLPKGGNVALQGTSNSKMVTLSTSADGSLKLLSDDGVSAATTAAFGVPLVPASSTMDIGTLSSPWGTVYATSIGTASRLVPVFSSTLACTSLSGSTGTFTGALTCTNITATGTVSLPASSLGVAAISGLAAVATSGSAADLSTGLLALARVPNLPASQITSGTFSVGAFGSANISTSGTIGGASSLSILGGITGTTGTFSGSVSTGAITASGAVNPNADSTLNLGASGTRWANVYANTLSATKYTGLPSKCWNAVTQGTWGGPGGALYKIASVPSIGDAAGGGGVRITGSLGGFDVSAGAILDCTISSRGYFVKGSLHGFVNGTKNSADIVTYVESNGSFSVYIKVTGYYVTWDLSVQPAGINVNVYEPSSTNTTSPTGTLNTASVLSVLSAVTDTTMKATSFGNFSFTSNATNLTWATLGSSNGGSIACGNLACANLTASGPSFSIGSLLGTSAVAGGPYIVSGGFDAVGTTHSVPIPPGGRNQAGILHIFAKNLNGNYGGSKSGYMKLYFSALEGDQNNTFGIVESYAPRITTFTAAGSGQGCSVTTDSDCCVSYRFEGAV
jgi:fibronectin-binding autotransporter adhesin